MNRPRSLLLSLENIPAEATVAGPAVLRREIFNSLRESGIHTQNVEGIECFSKVIWYVVFKTKEQRQQAKNKEIKLHNQVFKLQCNEMERPVYRWVRIYGYPLDSRDDILKKTMSLYGELLTVTDDVDSMIGIKTGVKVAQFKSLKGNIPSFIYAGKYRVKIMYSGQVRTCRNCQKEGHEAKDCTAGKVCQICGEPGHTKGSCPERRCYHCQEKGHESARCPQYLADFPGLSGNKTPVKIDTQVTLPEKDDQQTSNQGGSWGDSSWDFPTDETPNDPTDPTNMEVVIATTSDTISELEVGPREPSVDPVGRNAAIKPPDHKENAEKEMPNQGATESENPSLKSATTCESEGSSSGKCETQASNNANKGAKQQNPETEKTEMPNNSMDAENHSDNDSEKTVTPHDSEGSTSEEEEPPQKTLKTPEGKCDMKQQLPPEVKNNNNKQGKRSSRRNKNTKRHAIAVSGGKNRNPFKQ